MSVPKIPESVAQAAEWRAVLAGVPTLAAAKERLDALAYVAQTVRARADEAMTRAISGVGRPDDAVRWGLVASEVDAAHESVAAEVHERERQLAEDRVRAEDRAARPS